MPSMQHYCFLLAVLAAVAAASAASQLPESKSAKNQRFNSMKSHDELFDSKADKSTIPLSEQKMLEGHRDLHVFRLLSGTISDNSKSAKNQRFNSMKSHDELFDSKADKSTISLSEQKMLEGHRDLHVFRLLSGTISDNSKSAKNQRFNSMKSHDELFDSKADKSTISLREQKNLKGHRDLHDFPGLLSGAISDNRSVLSSDYTVSLHVFLPTVLPLMDDHSKNIFQLVALEFIVSNIDDENLPIESISNIQITEQDLAWSSIFDDLRTPGIEVFFRADAVVSGRTSQEAVEQSIQFMFDSKSTLFQEMFDIAKEYPIDGSSASSPAPSIGLLEPSIQPTVLLEGLSDPLTTPPSTLLPGPSTESPASQALSVGPPDLSTVPPRLTQPLAPSAILPDPSTKLSTPSTSASRPGSTFLAVVIISTITGSASFVVILLLISRYVRKARDSNGEKLPLETTMQSEDKEGHDQTKTSFVLEDDDAMIDLHDTTKEQPDREFIVSDEESESVASTLAKDTLAKDYIDTHMYFDCDESAIKSSIASSSSSNSGSTDSYNYSQKSVITLEDLDNFDSELRQSEC